MGVVAHLVGQRLGVGPQFGGCFRSVASVGLPGGLLTEPSYQPEGDPLGTTYLPSTAGRYPLSPFHLALGHERIHLRYGTAADGVKPVSRSFR